MLIISKIHLIMTFIILSCIYVEISTNIKPLTVLSSEIIQNPDIYHTWYWLHPLYCIYTRTRGLTTGLFRRKKTWSAAMLQSPTCIKTWNSLLSALMVNPCVFMVTLHTHPIRLHLQAPFVTYIHTYFYCVPRWGFSTPIYMEW